MDPDPSESETTTSSPIRSQPAGIDEADLLANTPKCDDDDANNADNAADEAADVGGDEACDVGGADVGGAGGADVGAAGGANVELDATADDDA